jgi:hypothetical protein
MARLHDGVSRAFLDMAETFRQGQPAGMMATEFLVNPGVYDEIARFEGKPTKLMRAVQAMRRHLARVSGFWAAPPAVEAAMRLLDAELRGARSTEEAAAMIKTALFERDLPSFAQLEL